MLVVSYFVLVECITFKNTKLLDLVKMEVILISAKGGGECHSKTARNVPFIYK